VARTPLTRWLPLAAMLGTAPLASHAQQSTPFNDYVEISGKKNPELLPEWLVWKHVFMTISSARADNLRGFTKDFDESFTPSELRALYDEADAQARRDQQYFDAMDRTKAQLDQRGVDFKAAANELFEVELRHRQKVLDARDRVFAALSPESQVILGRFAEETRSSISSLVPRSELEQFRRPR
jgi:hypothetical protein